RMCRSRPAFATNWIALPFQSQTMLPRLRALHHKRVAFVHRQLSQHLDLSTLMIKTRGRTIAWQTLRKFEPPHPLNLLHHLQIENLLARYQLDPNGAIKTSGLEGVHLWRFYLQEEVFRIDSAPWEAALQTAIRWTQALTQN